MADGKAEEALAALARDLVEEISAGRALELAADETLDLVAFPVRPFNRLQRTRTGRVIPEEVRQHMSTRQGVSEHGDRFVQGAPGHDVQSITAPQWAAGQKEFEARGRAKFDAKRAKALGKLHGDIGDTHQLVTQLPGGKDQDRHPGSGLFHQHAVSEEGKGAYFHLLEAQHRLAEHQQDTGKLDQNSLADAYHHLHMAHQAGVDQVLPRAHTPEEKKDVRATLDRLQGHMEKLDEIAGVKPQMTRRLLGTSGDQARRAKDIQDAALSEATRHAENGNVSGVEQHARTGLLSPENARSVSDLAAATKAQQEAVLNRPAGPKPLTGAAAIYPQVGTHNTRLAGGTLSGHEFAGRAIPTGQLPAPSPEARALERANARVQQFADRAAAQRAQDKKDHLAAIKALEAERAGISPGKAQPLTDEQFAAHKDFVDKAVNEALAKGLATSAQYSPDGGFLWSPQRALEHIEILHEFMNQQLDVPSQRQALFMGGLGGAGKTTTLKQVPDITLKDFAILNPDHFKNVLAERGLIPEVPGLSPLEASPLVHDESSYLADQAAALLRERGKNIAFDITMSSEHTTRDRVQALKDRGYRVQGVFVDIPVETAVARAESRYRTGLEAFRAGKSPLGSRHVPPDLIRSHEVAPGVTRNKQNFDKLKPMFASWQLWSNAGAKPQLVDRGGQQPGGSIPSVETLRQQYLGNTEAQARAAEQGTFGKGQVP